MQLRRLAVALLMWYVVQFAAGMTVNLFVKFPPTHPGTTGREYFGRSAASRLWALSVPGGLALLFTAVSGSMTPYGLVSLSLRPSPFRAGGLTVEDGKEVLL